MRIAMTGQPATRPAGQQSAKTIPMARSPKLNPALAIKAEKLSSQKAAAIIAAPNHRGAPVDMEKPLADFMRFSTVFSFIYLFSFFFFYFKDPLAISGDFDIHLFYFLPSQENLMKLIQFSTFGFKKFCQKLTNV